MHFKMIQRCGRRQVLHTHIFAEYGKKNFPESESPKEADFQHVLLVQNSKLSVTKQPWRQKEVSSFAKFVCVARLKSVSFS
jgi:hypothetical protein